MGGMQNVTKLWSTNSYLREIEGHKTNNRFDQYTREQTPPKFSMSCPSKLLNFSSYDIGLRTVLPHKKSWISLDSVQVCKVRGREDSSVF